MQFALTVGTIEDRIVQQCILQVMEPICEAKFHPHSYGFRPNRGTNHAIARANFLVWKNGLHYAVDIDIKSFFDNVNHAKLLKQIWSLGIRDKNLICIIGKMLKAEIEGIGVPERGTPQGGILSPLLSGIVLNELDWWVSNQWETFETKHEYKVFRKVGSNGADQSNKSRALRTTGLKEMYIVRYADDFKIFCRDYKTAQKAFIAVKHWLKERLKLDISEEKSKITNLRKNYSEFLGIRIKAREKAGKFVSTSRVTEKAKNKCIEKLQKAVDKIQENPKCNVPKYNAVVLGLQNYYSIATNVSLDFHEIAYIVNKSLYNRLKCDIKYEGTKSKMHQRIYRDYDYKTIYIHGISLFPIQAVKYKPPMNFSQSICNFTADGREKIHKRLERCDMRILLYLMRNPDTSQSTEFNDNRISLYAGQSGLCRITKQKLEIGKMAVHQVIPKKLGGSDKYENLIFITTDIQALINASDEVTINRCMSTIKPKQKMLALINEYRLKAGNLSIV